MLAKGFTLLHLMVATAVAAFTLGVSFPVEMREASVGRGVLATEAGMRALASAAREGYAANGAWPMDPTDPTDLADAIAAADGIMADLPAVAGTPLVVRHALGGAYQMMSRARPCIQGNAACPTVGWQVEGVSIGACGVPGDALDPLAARVGANAWIDRPAGAAPRDPGCVRWELAPFGREAAHLDGAITNPERLYADLGGPCAPDGPGAANTCPTRWTGDLEVENGGTPGFPRTAILRADRAADPVVRAEDATTFRSGVRVGGDFNLAPLRVLTGTTGGANLATETIYTRAFRYGTAPPANNNPTSQ